MFNLRWDHEGMRGFGAQHGLGVIVLLAVAFLVVVRFAFKSGFSS